MTMLQRPCDHLLDSDALAALPCESPNPPPRANRCATSGARRNRQYAKDTHDVGFWQANHDARAEVWAVNHSNMQRHWRQQGLRVPEFSCSATPKWSHG